MSFEVTTVNRHAARRILQSCGVRPEMARTMSLKQLKEHLDNFISLGTIPAGVVAGDLQREQDKSGQPTNAGAAWTLAMDTELTEHFRRGMSVSTMAVIKGRTIGGINARLQHLGIQKYNNATGKHDLTPYGKKLLEQDSDYTSEQFAEATKAVADNGATKAGEFASAAQIKAMDEALKATDAIELVPDEPVTSNELTTRVVAIEQKYERMDSALGKIAHKQMEMNQTIADTIAAEVKKVQGAWTRIEVKVGEKIHKMEGLTHKAFPKLLRAVSARTRHDGGALNIWLYGPAGTGKSTAARKLAEAFKMDFHTNGPVGSQWDIRGFTDAQGKIVETAFRKAWINGGVYCWDEGDGSAPAALIEANGALATGFASFPDGAFQRHADCIIIINGNLRPGAAPDATYNGRYKQDTAFVNRFVAIHWGIDEDLERALLGELDDIGEQWLRFVRKLRRKVEERGIKGIVISPRQLQYGLALLDAGAELDEAMEQTVKFMFTDDQWKQVAA